MVMQKWWAKWKLRKRVGKKCLLRNPSMLNIKGTHRTVSLISMPFDVAAWALSNLDAINPDQ